MSNLFGGGGGGTKGVNPTQGINIPYFTAQGGITPEQQANVDYMTNQQRVGEANLYGREGLGASTMATQGAEGAATGGAALAGRTSDINTGANYDVYQNQVKNFEEGLANQSELDRIANNANAQNSANFAKDLGFLMKGAFGGSGDTSNAGTA